MSQQPTNKLKTAIRVLVLVFLSAIIVLQLVVLNKLRSQQSLPPVMMTATSVTLPSAIPSGMDASLVPVVHSENDMAPSVCLSDVNNSDPGVDAGDVQDVTTTEQ